MGGVCESVLAVILELSDFCDKRYSKALWLEYYVFKLAVLSQEYAWAIC